MKKVTNRTKLTLKLETVKALKPGELIQVVGGATNPCAHPTTTVLRTFDC
jgi:hypothetical protein